MHDGAYRSLPKGESVLAVGLNRAVVLIAEKASRGGTRVLRELGAHPANGEPVRLRDGRYGPYVEHGRLRASLPKGASDDAFTLEEAVRLLAAKAAQPKKTRAGGGKTAKTQAKAKAKAGASGRSKAKRGRGSPAGDAP